MSALEQLASSLDGSATPDDRSLELRAAFRQAHRAPAPASAPAPARRPWLWGLAAAAAVVLVAIAPRLVRRGTPDGWAVPSARPSAGAAAVGAPPSAPGVRTAHAGRPSLAVAGSPHRPPSPSPRREATTPAPAARSEEPDAAESELLLGVASAGAESRGAVDALAANGDASSERTDAPTERVASEDRGFRPLPGAEPAEMDSAQILRVELRPDVLDAAGLPARPANARGLVEAEVLVGPDGVARGIRLASPRR